MWVYLQGNWGWLLWALAAGILLPHFPLKLVTGQLQVLRAKQFPGEVMSGGIVKTTPAFPAALGWVERALVFTALVGFQQPAEFIIGGWLVLKSAIEWRHWREGRAARATYTIFMTGTGMSLLFAIMGFGIVYGAKEGIGLLTCWAPLGMYTLALVLYAYLWWTNWKISWKKQTPGRHSRGRIRAWLRRG